MTGASAAAKEHAIATKGAAGSTDVFVAKQKAAQTELKATATVAKGTSTAMKALSIAGNMIAMWAITEGIQLAAKLVDKLIVTTEELKEAADNAINELNNLQSETDSLNQELTTTRDRITELENKPSLSFIEQEELQKLRDASSELERQIELNKTLLNVQEGKTRDSALDYLNKQTQYEGYGGWDMSQVRNGNARYGTQNVGTIFQGNQLEVAQRQLQEYENIAKRKENVEKRIASFKIANPDETKYTQDQKDALTNLQLELQSYDSTLKALNDSLYDVIPNLDTYKNALNPDYDQSYIDFIDKLIDGYNQLFGDSSGTKTEKFDDIWNSDDFKTYKSELESLAKEGKLDASVLESNEQYKKLLEETGATAEQTAQHINSLVSAEQGTANVNKTDILSFSDAWEDLKNSTDDATKTLADDLTELAEAGQLTLEAFSETDSTGYFENLGISAEEATKQINALVSASTQLQSMSAQISKMSDILADKKNGTVASASDLAGFDVEVRGLDSWSEFEKVMGSSKSSMEECQAAANALATEWINNGNYLANLTEENKDYYQTQLSNMGIENAAAIVSDTLSAKKIAEKYAIEDLSDATRDEISVKYQEIAALVEEGKVSETTASALYDLIYQQTIFSNQNLDVYGKISALQELALAFGITADAALGASQAINLENQLRLAKHYGATDAQVNAYATQLTSKMQDAIKAKFGGISTSISPTGSGNYNGGSSKSGGSGSGSDTKQTIDWIERLLDVLQKKIDQTKAKFENLFTLKDKKNNLTEQLSLTKTLLTATEKSAKRYKKAADKVKLSDKLKTKVQNGDYDISEYDSETADAINKYKEYYDQYLSLLQEEEVLRKDIRDIEIEGYQLDIDHAEALIAKSQALAALDEGNYKKQNKHLEGQKKYLREQYEAQIKIAEAEGNTLEVERLRSELLKELRNNTKEQFDNIDATYSMKIGFTNNKVQAFQDQISLLEAQGQQIGSRLYTKQMELNQLNINKLNAERRKQIKKVDEFGVGTKEWYEAQDAIFATEHALKEYEIEQANLQKSINQLKFDRFDNLLNKLNDIVEETDFLISMLDSENFYDDNGNMTSDGVTAMGLTAQNYDTYLAEAEKYKQMLSDVKDMYDEGKISLEDYEEYQRKYSQSQRNAIKSANEAKKSVIDYVKQGLEAQNNALSEAINKQKELLQSEKDLKDFQDRLADSNKSIADIQKQINALESDNSESNRKKLQQLKSDLANAQKDQEDLLYDRSISDQEDALDQMLKNSQEQTENYLKDSEKVFVDALAYVNAHSMQVSNNLEQISKDTGYNISENITNAWKDAGKAVDSYESILTGNIPSITSQIQLITTAWQNACDAAEKASKAIVNAIEGGYIEHTTEGADAKVLSDIEWYIQKNGVAPKNKPSSYSPLNQYIYEKTGKVIAEDKQAGLAKILGITGLSKDTSAAERAKILKALKAAGFSNGGFVNIKDTIRYSGEDGLALVKNDEYILSPKQTDGFLSLAEHAPQLAESLKNMTLPQFSYPQIDRNIPIANRTPTVVNNTFDNRVTVEGVATDKIVKDFENVATKQAENVVAKINSMAYAKGVRHR